jgi:hypothetical protein
VLMPFRMPFCRRFTHSLDLISVAFFELSPTPNSTKRDLVPIPAAGAWPERDPRRGDLVLTWYRPGTDLVPTWHRPGTNLALTWP